MYLWDPWCDPDTVSQVDRAFPSLRKLRKPGPKPSPVEDFSPALRQSARRFFAGALALRRDHSLGQQRSTDSPPHTKPAGKRQTEEMRSIAERTCSPPGGKKKTGPR